MTSSGAAPAKKTVEANVAPVAAASDLSTVIGEAPIAGVVSGVSYTPLANITGHATESRQLTLINKGQDGNGTTVLATLDMTAGVNPTDFNEYDFTLSAVEDALNVEAGDVLGWTSVHEGSTGLADPGGRVKVEISRD